MKHLKAIFEYEDDEIRSMMGDLEEVGLGNLKGWLIVLTNRHGLMTCEMLIAEDWKEAGAIYNNHGTVMGQGVNLASALGMMKNNSSIVSWDIVDGLKARTYKSGYKKWDMADPYYTVEVLNHFFSNSKDIMGNITANKISSPQSPTEIKEV